MNGRGRSSRPLCTSQIGSKSEGVMVRLLPIDSIGARAPYTRPRASLRFRWRQKASTFDPWREWVVGELSLRGLRGQEGRSTKEGSCESQPAAARKKRQEERIRHTYQATNVLLGARDKAASLDNEVCALSQRCFPTNIRVFITCQGRALASTNVQWYSLCTDFERRRSLRG